MQLLTNNDPFFANNTHRYGFQWEEKDDELDVYDEIKREHLPIISQGK